MSITNSWPVQAPKLHENRIAAAVSLLIIGALIIVFLWVITGAGVPARTAAIGEEIPSFSNAQLTTRYHIGEEIPQFVGIR
jgi:hypothetical protein